MKDWNNNREDQQFNMWRGIKRTWDSPRVHFLAGSSQLVTRAAPCLLAGGFFSLFSIQSSISSLIFLLSFFLFIIPHFSSWPSLHACHAVGLSWGFPGDIPYDVISPPTFNQRFCPCVCAGWIPWWLLFLPLFFLPFCWKGSVPLEKTNPLFLNKQFGKMKRNKLSSKFLILAFLPQSRLTLLSPTGSINRCISSFSYFPSGVISLDFPPIMSTEN